jgi:hypothetical protein
VIAGKTTAFLAKERINIARELKRLFNDSKVVLIEKEEDCGLHARVKCNVSGIHMFHTICTIHLQRNTNTLKLKGNT